MKAFIAATAVLLAVGACASGSDDAGGTDEPDATSAAATTEETSEEAEPEPVQEIDGTFEHSCDYLLGEALDDYWFVADAVLSNSGNIGTIDRVTVRWYLAGGEVVTEQREVRNLPGRDKRVGFKVDATSDQIDQIMALSQDGLKTCDVKVRTMDTFGEIIE